MLSDEDKTKLCIYFEITEKVIVLVMIMMFKIEGEHMDQNVSSIRALRDFIWISKMTCKS